MAVTVAELASRAVLHVTGEEALPFLDRIVTVDMDAVMREGAGYGALLSPQGKVLTDFVILTVDDGFLIDCPAAAAADLLKRLTLYRLRAKATVEDVSGKLRVLAVWGTDDAPAMPGRVVRDPRLAELGFRAVVPRVAVGPAEALPKADIVDETVYAAHAVGCGIPTLGVDAAFADVFPHDLGMDALGGVAFDKGCYVGQEVVSRMEHRASARRRPVVVTAAVPLPPTGTEVTAGGRPAGTLGAVDGTRGVALLRLDRIAEATAAGEAVIAGTVPVSVDLPDWARWGWPDGGAD
jgi:folate-binding protein YgfZ